jgi:hypothetical protein
VFNNTWKYKNNGGSNEHYRRKTEKASEDEQTSTVGVHGGRRPAAAAKTVLAERVAISKRQRVVTGGIAEFVRHVQAR